MDSDIASELDLNKLRSSFRTNGFYRCTLGDISSSQLLSIVQQLGQPHRHNNSDSFVWDIKPTGSDPSEAPRSHTSLNFSLHSDCSYEYEIPSGVVLYAVRQDRLGGGISEILDTRPLLQLMDKILLGILSEPFPIKVPQEFYKGESTIYAPVVTGDRIRFRSDLFILELLSPLQQEALEELNRLISISYKEEFKLEDGEALFLDNLRMLHGRSKILDPNRHLLRVRYFAS